MIQKTVLTKKEVIVVLGCVVFCTLNLLAACGTSRRHAKYIVCQANLKQWGKIFYLFAQDNEDNLPQSIVVDGSSSALDAYWLGATRPYYQDYKTLLCPSTKPFLPRRPRAWDNYGETFLMWGELTEAAGGDWAEESDEGSYGINDWAACPPTTGGSNYWGFPKDKAWRTVNAEGGNNIPLLLDCAYLDGFPQATNSPDPLPEELRLPSAWAGGARVTGSWASNSMRLFAIDRHNGAVNGVFLDASARKVGLKSLWNLKWHKGYTVIVPPQASWDWPEWMQPY